MTSSVPSPGAPTPPDGGRVECVHCGQPVVTVRYALGPKLVHEHPSRRFGSEYWHCKTTVAALAASSGVRGGDDQARERLADVLALHQSLGAQNVWCGYDGEHWPCATVRAAGGGQ